MNIVGGEESPRKEDVMGIPLCVVSLLFESYPRWDKEVGASRNFTAVSLQFIEGDVRIAVVVIQPKEIVSLVEVYLQTLCFRNENKLPPLNNRIG